MAQNPATDPQHVDPEHPRPGEAAKPEAPAAQGVGPTPAEQRDRPLPTASQINDALLDASGDAVSAQPFDSDPTDLQDARERIAWDADTAQN